MQLKNTNLDYLLSQLGLTLNESRVYLYLLQFGTSLGNEIIASLQIDKSSCYRAIHSLIQKNLVCKAGEERNQQFSPNPPEYLQQLVVAAQQKLDATKLALSKIEQIIPEYIGQNYKNKHITVITSPEGYSAYMEARLESKSKLIRDLSTRTTAAPFYSNYDVSMLDYVSRRVKAGIFLRQLGQNLDHNSKWDKTSKALLKEVRPLPPGFVAPAVFSSWDDYSALFSISQNKITGFMVRDSLITELLNSFFDAIWNNQSYDAVAKR